MKKIRTLLMMSLAALGFGLILPTTTASAAKHVTTPKSVRGTWVAKSKHFKQRLKLTKYALTVTKYKKNGHVDKAGSYTAYGNKKVRGIIGLHIVKYTERKGYWIIGLSQSDDNYILKKVKHNGKAALRNYYSTFNPKHPKELKVRYYYRVK